MLGVTLSIKNGGCHTNSSRTFLYYQAPEDALKDYQYRRTLIGIAFESGVL